MLLVWFADSEYVDHKGAHGIRGRLFIGPASWPVVARAGRHKRILPEHSDFTEGLHAGQYQTEFGWWTSRRGSRARAVRLLGSYSRGAYPNSRGRIYIHPANWPHQLTGCVAPGLHMTTHGVGRSRDALDQIFAALGGWRYREPAGWLSVEEEQGAAW